MQPLPLIVPVYADRFPEAAACRIPRRAPAFSADAYLFFRTAAPFRCTGSVLRRTNPYDGPRTCIFLNIITYSLPIFRQAVYFCTNNLEPPCLFYYIIAQPSLKVKHFSGNPPYFRICAPYKSENGAVLHVLHKERFITFLFLRICLHFVY